MADVGHASGAPGPPRAEADVVGWLQQVLREERKEVERMLLQRHEDIILHLRRSPQLQAQGGTPLLLKPPPSEDVMLPPGTLPDDEPPLMSVSEGAESFKKAASLKKLTRSKTTIDQILQEFPDEDKDRLSDWQKISRDFLEFKLDIISGAVIILYVFMIAVKAQYTGYELAHVLAPDVEQFRGRLAAEEVWPHAKEVFVALEWVFFAFFILELMLRMIFRIRVGPDRYWNTFDAVIIVLFLVEQCIPRHVLEAYFKFDPTIMRMARLIRLMRLLKLVRYVKSMGPLLLICKAIMSTMSVLGYSIMVIFLLMMVVSVVNVSVLDIFIRDPEQDSVMRAECYQRWGSFWRALLSMFEITLANWGPHCWFLVNNVSEGWGLFFIMWKCIIGFAVIQVISSVFIQHTFKTASRDEDVMIQEKAKAREHYMKHLDKLFSKLSTQHDSFNKDEFERALKQDRVKDWFGALDIEIGDAAKVFNMLDDGDGEVGKGSFIDGLRMLKGPAKSIDLIQVVRDCSVIRAAVEAKDVSS